MLLVNLLAVGRDVFEYPIKILPVVLTGRTRIIESAAPVNGGGCVGVLPAKVGRVIDPVRQSFHKRHINNGIKIGEEVLLHFLIFVQQRIEHGIEGQRLVLRVHNRIGPGLIGVHVGVGTNPVRIIHAGFLA